MNTEIKDGLTRMLARQYSAGYYAGQAASKIDRRFVVVLAFLVGAIFGIVCGLGMTGWL